jgi:hypothetical protein
MTVEQKREICKAYAFGHDVNAIADMEDMPETAVQAIIDDNPEIVEEYRSRGEE